jgi:hypothetical protein
MTTGLRTGSDRIHKIDKKKVVEHCYDSLEYLAQGDYD